MAGELLLGTLRHVVETLRAQGVPAAVMGGLAITHWGHARFTRDVDLLIDADVAAADDLVRALVKLDFFPRRIPPLAKIGHHSFVQLLFTPPGRYEDFGIDLLYADSAFFRSALTRAKPGFSGDQDLLVVSCEDLLLLKLQADRAIDRSDVITLLQRNRAELDFSYMAFWVPRLKLEKEWTEWWSEAFPGELPPG